MPAAESIDSVEKAAGEWARMRAETVRVETEWKSRQELQQSSLVALRERVRMLESRKAALLTKTAADRQTLADLQENTLAASEGMKAITARLEEISTRLLVLRTTLPPRLSEALELPYRSLADAKVSPGDRVQLIVKLLHRSAQFSKTITLADEPLALEGDDKPRMLEVLYWGLNRAYALDRSGGKAYYGQPGEKTWTWEILPTGTDKNVAALIAIYKDKADPTFIDAPARVAEFPKEPTAGPK